MEILRTERLIILPWIKSDLADASKLWGDPNVMAFIDTRAALNSVQVQEKLAREIECEQKYGVQYWKAIDKTTQTLVGCCGLRPWAFGPNDESSFEISFHIVPHYWGKGLATEAACGVLELAFEKMMLPKLRAGHHPNNLASRRILEKLGFRYVGDVLYPPTGLHHPTYELLNQHRAT